MRVFGRCRGDAGTAPKTQRVLVIDEQQVREANGVDIAMNRSHVAAVDSARRQGCWQTVAVRFPAWPRYVVDPTADA